MNVKRELIALAVRVIANETNLIRKPSDFEAMLYSFFGEPSYDQKIAATIEEEADRMLDAAKRINTNRKFKKIVKNV
jgi:hypothetical protein